MSFIIANNLQSAAAKTVPTGTAETIGSAGCTSALIYNNDASNTIFWGGPGVTTSTGIPLAPGEFMTFQVMNLDKIYVISAAGGENLRVSYGG